jgi:glutamate racemase
MKSIKENPIGIFDSGIGGTSIWSEIHTLLPLEKTIYLSDSKNAPYGQKPTDQIIALAIKNTEYLLNKNCKLIVVACNTATTNAIKHLRERYQVPFIGIEPAIKPASLKTKTKTIGILATQGTLNSQLFARTANNLETNIKIIEQIGNGLVELIENNKLISLEMDQLLKKHLKPFIENNIDHLVLGCTHYPYLIPQIKEIIGNQITIIDSGEAVARQTKAILEKNNLLSSKIHMDFKNEFYINTTKEVLENILEKKENISIKQVAF